MAVWLRGCVAVLRVCWLTIGLVLVVCRERIMSARGDAKTMLAAQARRNDAFKAVDRAICAVNDAMSALDAFDAQPVPNAADLVALSSSVSDAKVLADFAYELVADVTDNGKSEEHTKTWGVRVLQRSRALVADAAEKVKDGKVVVTKLERHTAFNICALPRAGWLCVFIQTLTPCLPVCGCACPWQPKRSARPRSPRPRSW